MKKQKTTRKMALWLDHTHAHFIRVKDDKVRVESVESEYEPRVRIDGEGSDTTKVGRNRVSNREHTKHQKEQNQLSKFYKQLAGKLEKYDFVYLFGPTTAKSELLNYIRQQTNMKGKTFVVDSADTMTFPQMIARAKAVIGEEK
jgi:hypothetical protein